MTLNEDLAEAVSCVHDVPLDKPCDDCEGKASDGGFDGSGLRIVDPGNLVVPIMRLEAHT